jgi:hypoxanthine phosphoribosyltransferase
MTTRATPDAGNQPPPHDIACLISAEQVARRVQELAQRIAADYAGRAPVLVGVLKGAWVFLADLARQLPLPVRCDFVRVSSYGAGTVTSGEPRLLLDCTEQLTGADVLVVEDIIDTGLSTAWLLQHLRGKRPASLRLCALLDKPSRRRVPVHADYLGFEIPDRFVVGYGLDWNERYRELPYVGCVTIHESAGQSE